MERCMNHPSFPNRHVGGQSCVQSADEIAVRMRPVKVNRSNLTRRVNAGIRSPCKNDQAPGPSQFEQGFFEFTLHRSGFCLPLASEKVRAVVDKSQLVTCHCSSDFCRQEKRLHLSWLTVPGKPLVLYSSTNSKITISAESPMRGPSFNTRV